MPGPTNKASRALADVRLQLRTGKTKKGRALEPEEITALEQKRDLLVSAIRVERQNKAVARITSHTTQESDRVIREVPQAVRGVISEEPYRRLGPAPQGAMEEALAERARANKRIRELRQEEKRKRARVDAAPALPSGGPGAVGASAAMAEDDAQSAEERRRGGAVLCANGPGNSDVQLTVETLPQMLPDIVDPAGQLQHDRCMSLFEPLLPLAMLRGHKQHEMRKQKWRAGPYLLHVGQTETPPEIATVLAQEWPTAPPSETLPRGAIYGIAWYGAPLPAAELAHDPWHTFGKWGMPVRRAVEFAEPVTGVSGKMRAWKLTDEATKSKVLTALSCGTLRTFQR